MNTNKKHPNVFFEERTEERKPRKQVVPTLRDQFAMAVLEGYLSNENCWDIPDDRVARWAYAQADSMLRAREAKP